MQSRMAILTIKGEERIRLFIFSVDSHLFGCGLYTLELIHLLKKKEFPQIHYSNHLFPPTYLNHFPAMD